MLLQMLCSMGAMALVYVAAQGVSVPGSTTWGASGIHRVVAGRPEVAPGFTLSLGAELGLANGLLLPGDTTQVQTQQLHLVWNALPELAVGLSAASTNVLNKSFPQGGSQALGDPQLHAKYAAFVADGWGLGGSLDVAFPVGAQGSGLVLADPALTFLALATAQSLTWLEVSANLGYVYDRESLAYGEPLNEAQHLAIGATSSNRLVAAVGAATAFETSNDIYLGPFLEFFGQYAPGVKADYNPLLATLGLKLFALPARALELTVGADIRLSGAPNNNSPYPGLLPWMGFAAATVHLDSTAPTAASTPVELVANPPGDSNARCPSPALQGNCMVASSPGPGAAGLPPARVVFTGTVTDDQNRPVRDAEISISGYQGVLLGTDGNGRFVAPPLDATAGIVRLTARAAGHEDVQKVVRGDPPEHRLSLSFTLPSSGQPVVGHLHVIATDSSTGQPLPRARVLVPALGRPFNCDARGEFAHDFKPRLYQVLVFAHGFKTQRKKVMVQAGDTFILNVEMHPKHLPSKRARR